MKLTRRDLDRAMHRDHLMRWLMFGIPVVVGVIVVVVWVAETLL